MKETIRRNIHAFKYVLIDAATTTLSFLITMVSFKSMGNDFPYDSLAVILPIIIIGKLIIYYVFGVYRILTSYISFEDIIKIVSIIIVVNVLLALIIHVFHLKFFPSVMVLYVGILEVIGMVIPRVLKKLYNTIKLRVKIIERTGINTLIIGAGSAGELALKEIFRNKELINLPVAILDNDPNKIGKQLMGVKIVGPIENLEEIIKKFNIAEAIIAIKNIDRETFNSIVDRLMAYHIKVKTISIYGDVNRNTKTSVEDIKVEDLLNRETINLDDEAIKNFIKDNVVLITGGGGSIGSELSRQIYLLEPKELVIFDIYENNAYDVQMELIRLAKKNPNIKFPKLSVRIGSVYNLKRLEEIFLEFKPNLVFHAAAYKHVPLMEDSSIEALRTNVLGTKNATYLSDKYNVSKFVLVSSDKAVRPTNIMGASKRLAEIIIQEAHENSKTIFSAVRFGNVLESNGSVVPLFKKQIADGGPVTVTHEDITRYFMTIPEAVGLILQSSVYAKDGELFVLDMGEPVKIYDLAIKMIKLAGHKPNIDINIEIVGLRPGEKLYEELLIDTNNPDLHRTSNNLIFVEHEPPVYNKELFHEVLKNFNNINNAEVKEIVKELIESYTNNYQKK